MLTAWARSLQALAGSLIALTTVSVGLRFYARRKMRVHLWVDDWLMVAALVTFIAIAGGMFSWTSTSVQSLHGTHAASVSPSVLLAALTFLSIFCLGCTKASACFLYRRIFNVRVYEHSAITSLINVSIVVIALWTVAFLILFGTSCDGHLAELLNPQTHLQACGRAWTNLLAIGISDLILDVWVLALPLLPVFRLHVSLARKLSIAGVFLLGAVALSASIARLVISTEFLHLGFANFNAGGVENELSKCFFFLMFECGISIIAINLPIIGPLVMHTNYGALTKAAQTLRSKVSKKSGGSNCSPGMDQEMFLANDSAASSKSRPTSDSGTLNKVYSGRHIHLADDVPLDKTSSMEQIIPRQY